MPGQELCAFCLKELAQRSDDDQQNEEHSVANAADIGIDSVSTMDEIELDIDSDLDDDAISEEDKAFFGSDDDDEEEEDADSDKNTNGGKK